MAKRKTPHGPQVASRQLDKTAQRFLAATGILIGCLIASIVSMQYAPQQEVPPARTDLYSSYRWGNCDTHPQQCSREYTTSDTATLTRHRPCMTGLDCPCSEVKNSSGSTVIYTFPAFNERCHYRRYVSRRDTPAEYVHGRVAREYEDLVVAGIDPLRLEKVVTSLSQMSSGNIGELVALKRPDLEERYWEEMKTFVQHNPKSAPPRKLQDLFKRWYRQDSSILPGNKIPAKLPMLGDFKWTIHRHSQLEFGERYNSGPFWVGGQPWRLIYYPQSDWDTEQFAIYLTPMASQQSRVGWLRQVSFNVRVHGHDSPSQSIWANWNHTYSVTDEDCVSGFSHFREHEILHMPGRGYLNNDTLEIRAILRVNALANVGPVKDASHPAIGFASLASGVGAILKDAVRLPADYKPLALELRETSVLSLVEALRTSSVHLDAFWAWCICLPKQAVNVQLYLSHLKFLVMAAGLAVAASLAQSAYTYVRKGSFVDPDDPGASLAFPMLDSLSPWQLLLFSLAARAALTRPAALSLVAHVLSSGALRRPVSLSQALRAFRLFGLAVAVDMLVTGGEIKLILAALLGMLLDLKAPPLLALVDGALCVALMSAVLLDCLLYHRTAAFMQGPLLHFLRAGEVEVWPGRDLLPHWKPAQETLHANTCMILFFTAAMLIIYPRIRPSLALLVGALLLLGAGWMPSLIWRLVHAWVAGLPQEVPEGHSWSQLAADTLVHAPAREALQTWDCVASCLQSCVRAVSVSAPRDNSSGARGKGQESKSGNSGTPAKEDSAEGTKGGTSPTAGKAKNSGGKAGAQKRSKQTPEPKKAAQGATAQQPKRPAEQKTVDIVCQPSDAAATIQLSPGAGPLHAADSEHSRQGPKQHPIEKASRETESEKAAEHREGSTKAKAARRKASKAPEPGSLQQVGRSSSSSALSGGASAPGAPPDRNAEETSSQSGSEEAAQSEPRTQAATPDLTPHKAGQDAEPCASRPGLIRLSGSPMRGQGMTDALQSRPPPLECLLPMAGPEQHYVKDASAEDLLLALLRGSTSAKESRPGNAARHQPASAAGQPAREGASGLQDALPYLVAPANGASAPKQRVPSKGSEAPEDLTCVMCWEKPRQATLAPCGHRALCASCTELLLRRGKPLCPICRRGVQSYILREFEV